MKLDSNLLTSLSQIPALPARWNSSPNFPEPHILDAFQSLDRFIEIVARANLPKRRLKYPNKLKAITTARITPEITPSNNRNLDFSHRIHLT